MASKAGIKANGACKDIVVALTRRFADTNQNLRPKAVDAITFIAKGVGKDIEKVAVDVFAIQGRTGVHWGFLGLPQVA